MGTRGRSRSAAILLGSVTEETIIETGLPLLAVKHFGARMGVLQALLDRGSCFAAACGRTSAASSLRHSANKKLGQKGPGRGM